MYLVYFCDNLAPPPQVFRLDTVGARWKTALHAAGNHPTRTKKLHHKQRIIGLQAIETALQEVANSFVVPNSKLPRVQWENILQAAEKRVISINVIFSRIQWKTASGAGIKPPFKQRATALYREEFHPTNCGKPCYVQEVEHHFINSVKMPCVQWKPL